MRDPFRPLPTPSALVLLTVLGAATYACWRAFPPLRTAAAPRGIVSLELARTPDRAAEIIGSWRRSGLLPDARRNVRIDFLFLALYSTSLALLLALAARAAVATRIVKPAGGETAGAVGSLAMWGAGALDAVENVALLEQLDGRVDRVFVGVAFVSAAAKFALIALGLLAALTALVAAAVRAIR